MWWAEIPRRTIQVYDSDSTQKGHYGFEEQRLTFAIFDPLGKVDLAGRQINAPEAEEPRMLTYRTPDIWST